MWRLPVAYIADCLTGVAGKLLSCATGAGSVTCNSECCLREPPPNRLQALAESLSGRVRKIEKILEDLPGR